MPAHGNKNPSAIITSIRQSSHPILEVFLKPLYRVVIVHAYAFNLFSRLLSHNVLAGGSSVPAE
jgi:hypothetical protein